MHCLQGSPAGLHFEPDIVVGLAIAAQCALVAFILLHTQLSLWIRYNASLRNREPQMRCMPLRDSIQHLAVLATAMCDHSAATGTQCNGCDIVYHAFWGTAGLRLVAKHMGWALPGVMSRTAPKQLTHEQQSSCVHS